MRDSFTKLSDLYLDHCKYEKNLSPFTIKAYRLDLGRFYLFVGNETAPELVNRDTIKDYLRHLFEKNLKETSVRRKMICIKSFFTFLESENRIETNPFNKLKLSIRIPKRLPEIMNLADIRALINSPKHELEQRLSSPFREIDFSRCENRAEIKTFQDVIILEILFATGMRVSELSNLDINDIDLNRKIIKVNGKGSKQRIVPIPNDEVASVLTFYIALRKKTEIKTRWMFQNRFGKRLTAHSIRSMVARYTIREQLEKRITPHTFRHTTATMLLENGTDIRFVQSLLGHTSIATTQIYTHVAEAAQRRIITLNHPRNFF